MAPTLEDFTAALPAIVEEAKAAYPGISLELAPLQAFLVPRLSPDKPLAEALRDVEANDLCLAFAVAAGDPKAVSYFEDALVRGSIAPLKRRGFSQEVIDEAQQIVRERVLFGGGRPRILDYGGAGPLRAWLRVSVARECVELRKREEKAQGDEFDILALGSEGDDPELAFFKQRYRDEYKQAFEVATQQLSSRERALLRQQYLLGMNVDEIGTVYQVHRSTAAR